MIYIEHAMLLEQIFLIFSVILYLIPLQKREPMERRMGLSLTIGSTLLVALALVFSGTNVASFFVAIISLGIITLSVHYCASAHWNASFYVAIWSVVTAKFFMNLWHVVYNLARFYEKGNQTAKVIGLIGYYMVVYAFVEVTIARRMPERGKYHIGPRQMTASVIFLIVFEAVDQMMRFVHVDRYGLMYYLVLLLVQFYCASLLFIQSELFKKSALEKELLTMNMLMKQKETQYELTRENIDLINRKCHDLKHQIRALRDVGDNESKEAYLKELERSVEIYGAIVKTGNDVLDTILTEKSLLCQAKKIKINCVADGSRLDFVDALDLYAILGNAVDNAMEAVEKFADARMRIIDIAVFVRDQFLVINISNPYTEELTFKNGIPLSTKPENGYHGYGLKSIRHSLERYDGTMYISTRNHTYELKMLLPLPREGHLKSKVESSDAT